MKSSNNQKSIQLLLLLVSYIITTVTIRCAVFAQEQKPLLRGRRQLNHRRLDVREEEANVFVVTDTTTSNSDTTLRRMEESLSCQLYQKGTYYSTDDSSDKKTEECWSCTFYRYDENHGHSPYLHTVEIVAGDIKEIEKFLDKAGAISGQSFLRWDSSDAVTVDEDNNTLTLMVNIADDPTRVWVDVDVISGDEMGNNDEMFTDMDRRNLNTVTTTGKKKTLVIRVVGDGIEPVASRDQLYQDIFGSENVSLSSQMEKCSGGQIKIEPFSGKTSGGALSSYIEGVVEIRMSANPNGQSKETMENYANDAAGFVFGDLQEQFDLVMFILPPGIEPVFAAYAYIGGGNSYYHNDSISDILIQMHEVGHNLGLHHAGYGSDEYGDPSGYMGYSTVSDNTYPRMCYNAANNYQLGWYAQRSISPTNVDDDVGTFTISGVAAYNKNDQTKFVSLRLEQEKINSSYYIGYNWAFGANTETQEDADKLIIVQKAGDASASEISWKKAALSPGESYIIDNYDLSGRSITVTFARLEDVNAIVDVMLSD
jgi:hypothetical protein